MAASRQLPVSSPPAPRQRSTCARQPTPAASPPINKLRNNPHTLIERRRLPRNRYEKMSGSREDMVRKTMPEPMEPLGELGSLIEKNVMPGRNDKHRRQLRQCLIAGQSHGYQWITCRASGIRLIECLQQLGIITITLAILHPRRRDLRIKLRHRINRNNLACALHGHCRRQSQIAPGTVAPDGNLQRITTPLISMTLHIFKCPPAIIQRSREREFRSQPIIERRNTTIPGFR